MFLRNTLAGFAESWPPRAVLDVLGDGDPAAAPSGALPRCEDARHVRLALEWDREDLLASLQMLGMHVCHKREERMHGSQPHVARRWSVVPGVPNVVRERDDNLWVMASRSSRARSRRASAAANRNTTRAMSPR